MEILHSKLQLSDKPENDNRYDYTVNFSWKFRRKETMTDIWEDDFYAVFKTVSREPFQVCWYCFLVNLEAKYAKVNLPVLPLLLVDENCP